MDVPSAWVYNRMSGAAGGQQFTYLRYAIDAPEHYIQLIFISLRSAWTGHEATFEDIAESVRFAGR
jgi:hypothetical protein